MEYFILQFVGIIITSIYELICSRSSFYNISFFRVIETLDIAKSTYYQTTAQTLSEDEEISS